MTWLVGQVLELGLSDIKPSCCSVTKSCPTLCNPMNCSMPGFPVLYYLMEFAQTLAHWVTDAIQPSQSLLPPSPLALNLSPHQGLFQWVGSSHQVAKELELQHSSSNEYSALISFRIDWFDLLAVQGTLKRVLSRLIIYIQRFLWKHLSHGCAPSSPVL